MKNIFLIMNWYSLVIKNYINFNGRARRKEYWMYFLFNTLFLVITIIIDSILKLNFTNKPYGLFYSIYSLATLLPSISVAVRRMHDVGKSGWFLLIPIYNLILAVTEGDSQSNEYGNNPKNN